MCALWFVVYHFLSVFVCKRCTTSGMFFDRVFKLVFRAELQVNKAEIMWKCKYFNWPMLVCCYFYASPVFFYLAVHVFTIVGCILIVLFPEIMLISRCILHTLYAMDNVIDRFLMITIQKALISNKNKKLEKTRY